MRPIIYAVLVAFFFAGCVTGNKYIIKPSPSTTASNPIEVCIEMKNVTVEPAKKGVNAGRGHNHLLVDVPLPSDLSFPIGKGSNYLHMGDGSKCKSLTLSPGFHTITSVFAYGNHVPYDPPLTDSIIIQVVK